MSQIQRLLLVRIAQQSIHPSRAFDVYVCAKAEVDTRPANQQVLYWQLVDPEFSLIEIRIDAHTGSLVSVTVVLYKGDLQTEPDNANPLVTEVTEGVPVFSLHLWQRSDTGFKWENSFVDIAGRCNLELVAGNLTVRFFPDPTAHVVRIGKTLWCNFSTENILTGFTLPELTPNELATLNDYFVFHGLRK